MDPRRDIAVLRGARRRLDMRDQPRLVGITRLGQVDLVTGPEDVALLAETGLWIIRRVDQQRARRQILRISPEHLVVLDGVLLYPDLTEDLDGRQTPEIGR